MESVRQSSFSDVTVSDVMSSHCDEYGFHAFNGNADVALSAVATANVRSDDSGAAAGALPNAPASGRGIMLDSTTGLTINTAVAAAA